MKFSAKYAFVIAKWKSRFVTVLKRELANNTIEGARNARLGERLNAARGDVVGLFNLYEPVLPRE